MKILLYLIAVNTAFHTVGDLLILVPPLLFGLYCTWFFWPRRHRPFKPICTTRLVLEEEE